MQGTCTEQEWADEEERQSEGERERGRWHHIEEMKNLAVRK